MAENKKSFVLYTDLIHTVNKMPDEKAGQLLKTILAYVNDQNPVVEDMIVDIVFEPIKQQMKRDLVKWDQTKNTKSESGAMGNLKRWNLDLYDQVVLKQLDLSQALIIAKDRAATISDKKTSHNVAKVAVNDNVTVNVNDTVIKEATASVEKLKYSDVVKNKVEISKFIAAGAPAEIEPYCDLWNLFAEEKGLSKINLINDSRRRKFKIRIKEKGFDFLGILKKASVSEFLKTGKWFGFDWIIDNDSNYIKVLEGNYDKKEADLSPVKTIQTPLEKKAQDILNIK